MSTLVPRPAETRVLPRDSGFQTVHIVHLVGPGFLAGGKVNNAPDIRPKGSGVGGLTFNKVCSTCPSLSWELP